MCYIKLKSVLLRSFLWQVFVPFCHIVGVGHKRIKYYTHILNCTTTKQFYMKPLSIIKLHEPKLEMWVESLVVPQPSLLRHCCPESLYQFYFTSVGGIVGSRKVLASGSNSTCLSPQVGKILMVLRWKQDNFKLVLCVILFLFTFYFENRYLSHT